ncbi:hypothetical protein TNCV_2624631 [Trichonephila clavipes]|nr:hypothetical protein TNCV_2624631 [Trichonephila clavipes]
MYANTTPTRQGLADIFENTGRFTDRSNSDGYSCHQVQFRFDGRVVNRCSERFMFRQALMHPSERLMIQLPPFSLLGMAMVFSGHEPDRALLGHYRFMIFWLPTTPKNPPKTEKGSSGRVEKNSQLHINKLTDSMPQKC